MGNSFRVGARGSAFNRTIVRFCWVVVVAVGVGAAAPHAAHAHLNSLAKVVRGPLARALLESTSEGRALTAEILRVNPRLAARASQLSASDIVLTHLSDPKAAEAAGILLDRIEAIQERLRMMSIQGGQLDDLDDALALLAREELVLERAEAHSIEFAPVGKSGPSVHDLMMALEKQPEHIQKGMKERIESILIGHDFSGIRPAPGKVSLIEGDLKFSNFRSAEISGGVFARSDLAYADFSGGTFEACAFVGARLTKSKFSGSQLRETMFREADLKGADFRRAKLKLTDFTGADLRGADFTGAHVGGDFFRAGSVEAKFDGAFFDETTKLPFSREKALELGMIEL